MARGCLLKKGGPFFSPGNLWSMPRFHSEEQELLYLTTNCKIITNNFTVQIPVDRVHFVVHYGCLSLAAHCAQLYQSLLVACQCLLAQVVLVVLYFHLYLQTQFVHLLLVDPKKRNTQSESPRTTNPSPKVNVTFPSIAFEIHTSQQTTTSSLISDSTTFKITQYSKEYVKNAWVSAVLPQILGTVQLTPTLIEKLHKLFYLLSDPANQGGEESIQLILSRFGSQARSQEIKSYDPVWPHS